MADAKPRSGQPLLTSEMTIVVVHGAWADGSSWSGVIRPLQTRGFKVVAAPIPLTSLSDDVRALDRSLDRTSGPVVLASHAYAGAVISASANVRVKSLVYIAGLTPAEGETVAEVFYREKPHALTAPETVVEVILEAVSQ